MPHEVHELTLHQVLTVTSQMLSEEMLCTMELDLRSLSNPPNQPAPFFTACVAIPWAAMPNLRPKLSLEKHVDLFFNVPFCMVAFLPLVRKNNPLMRDPLLSKHSLILQPPSAAIFSPSPPPSPNTRGLLSNDRDMAKPSAIIADAPQSLRHLSQHPEYNGRSSVQSKLQLSPYFQHFALVIPWQFRCILKAPHLTVSPAKAKHFYTSEKPQRL